MFSRICLFLIFLSCLLSLRWLFSGNMLFHSDLARDFVLMKDIKESHRLTLIGPRSGGIPGVFHGPLWIYLNLPMFILGNGNPLFVSFGWWIFYCITIFLVFRLAKYLYDVKIAWLSAVLYSSANMLETHSMNNPSGATIIFPIYFYFLAKYFKTLSLKCLAASWFFLGLMIQFQMAFAGPILILFFIINLYLIWHNKKFSHLVSLVFLLPGMSTFFLFDLRHNWLQTKAVVTFLSQNTNQTNLFGIFYLRLQQSFSLGFTNLAHSNYLSVFLVLLLLITSFQDKFKDKYSNLFLFFYFGFWFLTTFFHGQITNWYYAPFLSVICVILTVNLVRYHKLTLFIWSLLILLNYFNGFYDSLHYQQTNQSIWATWKNVKTAAEKTMQICGPNFGYFVYTPDLYGYELDYPLAYLANNNPAIHATPNQKLAVTCLLMAPNVTEHPSGQENWISGDIRLNRPADEKFKLENGLTLSKYLLTSVEQKVPSNPNLITNLFFR